MEACIYRLLKRYCREQPYYLHLVELFLQVRYRPRLSAPRCSREPGPPSDILPETSLGLPGRGRE